MGLLSKIKTMLGIGAKTTAPTQKDARKKGPFKGKKKPFEKKNKRAKGDNAARSSSTSSAEGDNTHRGPTRSRSAKPGKGQHRPHGQRNEHQKRHDSSAPHKERRHDRRDRKSNDRPPRIDHNLRNTPSGVERPGGAFTPEQLKAYAAEHAAWDPASYVVPEAEGKKRFVDFGLPNEILHAVADLEFQYCTPIQAQSLEFSLEGKHVAGRAQTGTGKTAAFLIAVLTRYLRTPERRNLKPGTPRALILAPTRELVIQICKDAEALGKYCGDVRSLAVYGGMDYDRQRRELEDAPVDILVATPGRLIDFVRNHIINLRQVDTLVIDEADRMLDMGFIPDVRAIVNRLPDRDHRCTMLYSATLNETVMNLAAMWMRDPVRVEVESETMTTETIRQVVYIARSEEKFKLLFNHLKKYSDARTIIFCNRKFTTERICENLRRRGIPCEMLSGDVSQVRRLKILEAFRAGQIRTVVATDVAGRGIHVDDIAFVVNYDFPYEPEDYVHRIGRTGRAGHTGTAISFADEDESFIIPDIEAYIKEPLKCVMPEEWMYEEVPAPEPRKKRGEKATRTTAPEATSEEAAPVATAPAEAAEEAPTTPTAEAPSTDASTTPPAPTAEATAEGTPSGSNILEGVIKGPLPQVNQPIPDPEALGPWVKDEAPATPSIEAPTCAKEWPEEIEVKGPPPQIVRPIPAPEGDLPTFTDATEPAIACESTPIASAVDAPENAPAPTAEAADEVTSSTEEAQPTAAIVVAPPHEIVVKAPEPVVVQGALPTIESVMAPAPQAEAPAEETETSEMAVAQPAVNNKHHVARPVNRAMRKGNAVVARPQQKKSSTPVVARAEKREEREPVAKTPHKHRHAQQQPFTSPAQRKHAQKQRPPRSNKPVAKRWARTQADGPRDGSESHHASPVTNRSPIYAPGTRGPITDEWTPGV